MKIFFTASLIAAVIAIETEEVSSDLVQFPVIEDGDTESKGAMREFMLTWTDENGDVHKEIWFEVAWRTGGESYCNYWIQTYLQMEDPKNEDMYMAMTCTAQYDKDKDFAQDALIQNYYGDQQITSEAIDGEKPMDKLATPAPDSIAWFKKDETHTKEQTYKSAKIGSKSY